MKHLLLCLFALLVTDMLRAQTDISDYSLRHFTSENGLSQSTVKSIAQDEYGFIWLATESGLLRFDGTGFRQFDKTNMDILSSRATDIQRNPADNSLLAIFDNEELIILSKGTAKKYQRNFHEVFLPAALSKFRYRPIKWLHSFQGADSMFFRLDKKNGALVAFRHGITWYNDSVYVGRTNKPDLEEPGELFRLGTAIYTAAPKLNGNVLQRITPGGIQRVMLRGDFLKLSPAQHRKKCRVESYDATGQAYIYAGDHLYRITVLPDGNLYTTLLLSGFDLDRQLIYCVYYDTLHGRIFMGSLTNGLYILDRKLFHTSIYEAHEISPIINVIYDIVPVNDSTVLAGNGILFCTNPAVRPVRKNFAGLFKKTSYSTSPVFRSRDGRLWISGTNDIRVLDSTADHMLGKWPLELPRTIAEGNDDRIWAGTDAKGLFVLDPHRKNKLPEQVLPGRNRIMCLEWEDTQTLWVGTVQHLLRYHVNTGRTDTIDGLTGKMTRSLYIPRAGEVWICTYEDGLYLWQPKRLTHFPVTNYPHLKSVHKILEDDNGFFWISTNHGIYQAKREDLLRYAGGVGREEKLYLFYYSKESGFLTNEFNGGSQRVGSRLANGFFSFSSMNGIVFFRPSAIKPELPDGKFIIDKAEVDDREVPASGAPITLNGKFRTLKITPVSAYMGNPANLRYEFRLNNDSDWRNTYNGAVILSALPAGNNEIYIRKKAGFGSQNYIEQKLVVYVPPAWWQTQWFYIAAGILLIASIWLIVRLRVRYWKKRNRLLETTVRDRTQDLRDIIHDLERSENKLGEQLQFQRMLNENITHDITTPLQYLTIFTGNVLAKTGEKEDTHTELEHIHQGANRIYEVVHNLGQYMRARLSKNISAASFDLHSLAEQKAGLFRIAAAARGNTIENNIPAGLLVHQNEALISIVLHNIIDNAIKNTEKGKIVVSTATGQNSVLLKVLDTGKGLTATQAATYNEYFRTHDNNNRPDAGFGFLIIKEIIQLLKLEINIAPAAEKGTIVTIYISPNDA